MLFVTCAVLGVLAWQKHIVSAKEEAVETLLKKLYKNIDGTYRKFSANVNIKKYLYDEVSPPPAYDYPEVWWTEGSPIKKTAARNTTSTVTTDILNLNTSETLKPTVIKKKIKIVNPGNQKAKIRSQKIAQARMKIESVTRVPITTTDIATQVATTDAVLEPHRVGKYYYVINRDDENGDLSVEEYRGKVNIGVRTNKGRGVHASVISGLTIDNDTRLSDFDYVIYDKNFKDLNETDTYYDFPNPGTENRKEEEEPIKIRVIKPEQNVKLLDKGLPIILNPKNNAKIPNVIRDGIYRIDLSNIPMKSTMFTTRNVAGYQPAINKAHQQSRPKNPNKTVNIESYFKQLVAKKLRETYVVPNRGFTTFVKELGMKLSPRPSYTMPTFHSETKIPYSAKDPQKFIREQLRLAKMKFEREMALRNTSNLATEQSPAATAKTESETKTEIEAKTATESETVRDINHQNYLPTIASTIPFDDIAQFGVESITPAYTTTTERFTLSLVTGDYIILTRPGGDSPPSRFVTRETFGTTPEVLSPFVHELLQQMEQLHMGYLSVAVIGLLDALAHMSDQDAYTLMYGFQRELENIIEVDRQKYLGATFLKAMVDLSEFIVNHSKEELKKYVVTIHEAMVHRREAITTDINSVIDFADKLYKKEEGIDLLKVIEKIHNFPKGKLTSAQLHRELTLKAYAPLTRLKDSTRKEILLDSINKLIENHRNPPVIVHRRTYPRNSRKRSNSRFNYSGYNPAILTRFPNTIPVNTYGLIIRQIGNDNFKLPLTTRNAPAFYRTKNLFTTQQTTPSEIFPKDYVNKLQLNKGNQILVNHRKKEKRKKYKHRIKSIFHKGIKITKKKLLKLKQKHPYKFKKYFKLKRKSEPSLRNRNNKKKRKKTNTARHAKKKLPHLGRKVHKYKSAQKKYKNLLRSYNPSASSASEAIDNLSNFNVSVVPEFKDTKFNKRTFLPFVDIIARQRKKQMTNNNFRRWESPKGMSFNNVFARDLVLAKKFENFNDAVGRQSKTIHLRSSYSDEEDFLRIKIHDALTRNINEFQARKFGVNNRTDSFNKINKFSSYSSEETVLKSKIYKSLTFDRIPNSTEIKRYQTSIEHLGSNSYE